MGTVLFFLNNPQDKASKLRKNRTVPYKIYDNVES